MALFGTQEWLDEFCLALNKDETYAQAARDYEGPMVCVSTPAADSQALPLIFYFDPYHGLIRDWAILSSPESRPADFILTAAYADWQKICRGRLDLIKAVMARKLKVQGRMTALLKHTRAAQALVRVMAAMDTEFEEHA